MTLYVVKFICKFPLIKDYKNITSSERNDLIKKCIEIARNKNGYMNIKSTIKNDLFIEIESELDGVSGILEVHASKIVFRGNNVSDSSGPYFEHYIKNIALVCQSHPDPLYFGYISRDPSKLDIFLYIFFSNKQAEAVYKCISKGFKKSFSTENTVDEQINYVSMSAKLPNRYGIDSQNEIKRDKEERRSCDGSNTQKSVTVNRNYHCLNHTRKESISSNISDLNMYAEMKQRNKQQNRTNEDNEMDFSLINPPIDDAVVGDSITSNTYVIEIIKSIPKTEIINFLKIKYDVNILCNSIFVERKRSCGDPYEDVP